MATPDFDAEATIVNTEVPLFVQEEASHETGIFVTVLRARLEDVDGRPSKWRAFEVWTRNRVYGLDPQFECIEVLDRRSGQVEPNNKVIGFKLGGGRLRDDTGVRYSYPFPLAGMEGMFARDARQVYTSRIERFVVRIRDLKARNDSRPTSWEDVLAGRAR